MLMWFYQTDIDFSCSYGNLWHYGITSLKSLDLVGMFETRYIDKGLYAAWSFKVHFQTATANVTQMMCIKKALQKKVNFNIIE